MRNRTHWWIWRLSAVVVNIAVFSYLSWDKTPWLLLAVAFFVARLVHDLREWHAERAAGGPGRPGGTTSD